MTEYPDIRFRKTEESSAKVDHFEVVTECRFITALCNDAVLPVGYRTDFASVPRWLWAVVPPHGRMANASVIHDYCYDNRLGEEQHGAKRARFIADMEFCWRCRDSGVPKIQIKIVCLFLRLFGRKWWDN